MKTEPFIVYLLAAVVWLLTYVASCITACEVLRIFFPKGDK